MGLTTDVITTRPYFVYRLRDPLTGLIRYIGISSNPTVRRSMHMDGSSCAGVYRWGKLLKAHSKSPIFEIISGPIPYAIARRRELRLIFLFGVMRPGQLINKRVRLRQQVLTEREVGKCAILVSLFSDQTPKARQRDRQPSSARTKPPSAQTTYDQFSCSQ